MCSWGLQSHQGDVFLASLGGDAMCFFLGAEGDMFLGKLKDSRVSVCESSVGKMFFLLGGEKHECFFLPF